MNYKQKIIRNLVNIPGWHTTRKIVVIESDDWGAIRTPSIDKLNYLLKKDVEFDLNMGFDNFDTIASSEDLENLFEVLDSVKDINNNAAKITANCVVANPNFQKIKESGYTEYHYEVITDTLNRYYPQSNPFLLWKEGVSNGIFHPQFHGREHLNFQLWLRLLQQKELSSKLSFEEGVFSMLIKSPKGKDNILAAYDYHDKKEQYLIKESIAQGLNIFHNLFGFQSLSAIAPRYVWDDFIEECYAESGVKYIQGVMSQINSSYAQEQGRKRIRYHYLGRKNRLNQYYIVRNAFFEPSTNPTFNYVDDCLQRMKTIFLWKKPVVISAHRLNFIGTLNKKNRDNNLKLFSTLLKSIVKTWSDVEFMTTDQLGNLMSKNV